jgi:hypothetical protein
MAFTALLCCLLLIALTSCLRNPSILKKTLPLRLQSSSDVLQLVEDVSLCGDEKDKRVSEWIDKKKCESLRKDDLFGNYEVSYVSQGGSQRGNPAGGGYRAANQLIFKTTGLYQHLMKPKEGAVDVPPLVIANIVSGRVFHSLEVHVVLYGNARFLSKAESSAVNLSVNAVEATFEPPKIMICFGTCMKSLLERLKFIKNDNTRGILDKFDCVFQVGPISSVILDTPFVDNCLRTGVGSRGSKFIFKRLMTSPDKVLLKIQERPVYSVRSLSVLFSVTGAIAGFLNRKVMGISLSVAAIALAYWKGGKALMLFYLFSLRYLYVCFARGK